MKGNQHAEKIPEGLCTRPCLAARTPFTQAQVNHHVASCLRSWAGEDSDSSTTPHPILRPQPQDRFTNLYFKAGALVMPGRGGGVSHI
jgi:hypothetical protein